MSTVVYQPSAEDDLARLWVESHDRQALADAADAIDHALRSIHSMRAKAVAGRGVLP
jgi:hypothetical protein